MITVNLQTGGTYNIAEDIVANIKSNSNGSEIVVVEAGQVRSIFSSQSPATVAGLSPYFLTLTDIQGARVEATIGYSGLVSSIDEVFNIGAGRWTKLTDNGTNSLTAIAQLVQNITVAQAISSATGYASVSSVSYSYPTNDVYLNALRINDISALGVYGGSLVKYDEGAAELAEYQIGIAPATLVSTINGLSPSGGSGWSLTGNAGTDPATNFIGTTDGEDFIIQPDAGNVGVGLIAPQYKVHFVGDPAVGFRSELQQGVDGTDPYTWIGNTDSAAHNVGIYFVGDDIDVGSNNGMAGSTMGFRVDGTMSMRSNGVDTMTLDTSNNVGIGTNSPTEKLEVVGNLALSGTIKGTTLPAFDDDADAASLATGDFYQTTGLGAAPLNAAGIVMVKQ